MEKKPITNPALASWAALNDALRDAGPSLCRALLREERKGRKRAKFMSRIHSRLNRMRAYYEREELTKL